MLNKINISTPAYNPTFKGQKEVKIIVGMAEKMPQNTHHIGSLRTDLRGMLGANKIAKQDIADASKQMKEDWKARILEIFSK